MTKKYGMLGFSNQTICLLKERVHVCCSVQPQLCSSLAWRVDLYSWRLGTARCVAVLCLHAHWFCPRRWSDLYCEYSAVPLSRIACAPACSAHILLLSHSFSWWA